MNKINEKFTVCSGIATGASLLAKKLKKYHKKTLIKVVDDDLFHLNQM